MRCPCKRRKTDFLCNEVYIGDATFECDDECEQLKEQKRKVRAGACVIYADARCHIDHSVAKKRYLLHCLPNVVQGHSVRYIKSLRIFLPGEGGG